MNPIEWFKAKREAEIKHLKLANCNNAGSVKFFLQVIEQENRVYNEFIFMPDKADYMAKLASIGFIAHQPIANNKTEFSFFYNDKLDIGVHIVKEVQWKALVATIDAVKQLQTPSDTKFGTINIVFNTLLTYKG